MAAVTLRVDDPEALERAAAVILRGGVVAIPTETFYGLAADARHQIATARVFEIKGRPEGMALPLVAASLQQVTSLLGPLDPRTTKAAKEFWPGPLSLIVNATPLLSATAGGITQRDSVTDRQPATSNQQPVTDNRLPVTDNRTVAIRVPGHDFVRALCDRAGTLLTATSANRTGEPPAETAEAVVASLGGLVDLVIDGGRTPGGLPSTIVDLRGAAPVLIRDGAFKW